MIIPGEKGFNVKDLMGNHYLFCHSFDAGIEVFPTHLTNIQDPFYARPFLMHLCELGSLGGALRDLYLYARPDTYQLHKKNDWEVLAQLIQMLETEELRVWLIRDILKEHAAALLAKSSSVELGAATSNAPAKPVVGSSPPKRSKPPADPLESSESSAKASVYEPETSNGEVSGEEPNMATKQVESVPSSTGQKIPEAEYLQRIEKLELIYGSSNVHSLEKHGAQTTGMKQYRRVQHKDYPNPTTGAPGNKTKTASKFLTNKDHYEILRNAILQKKANPETHDFDIVMDRNIGVNIKNLGSHKNRGPYSADYTNTARVRFDPNTGKIFTAFPIPEKK